jgi:hypothetical protein
MKMMEKAEEIRKLKIQAEKAGIRPSSSGQYAGFGSSSSSASSSSYNTHSTIEPATFDHAPPPPSFS